MRKILVAIALLLVSATLAYADGTRQHAFTALANDNTINLVGSGIAYNKVTWNKTGTVSVCVGKLQKSVDGAVWTDYIAIANCSANGASLVDNTVVNYVRMITTSFTGTGTVTVRWNGYVVDPSPGGLPGGIDTDVQFNDSSVLGGASQMTWDKTNNVLYEGSPESDFTGSVVANYFTGYDYASSFNRVNSTQVGCCNGAINARSLGTNADTYPIAIYAVTETTGTGSSGTAIEGDFIADIAMGMTATQDVGSSYWSAAKNGAGNLAAALTAIQTNISLGGGNTTDVKNIWAGAINGAGTATNAYGFYGDAVTKGATFNSIFYAASQTNTAGRYGFYSAGGVSQFDITKANTYNTLTNCADSAGAAACGSAAAGAVVVDAGATTVVVSTTAVTANSEIFVMYDSSLGTRLSVTCNVTVALPSVTARTAATSFTITVPVAPNANPACYNYWMVN